MDIWVLERGFSVERSLTLDPPKHADQAGPLLDADRGPFDVIWKEAFRNPSSKITRAIFRDL
jgi:hypothetical protein